MSRGKHTQPEYWQDHFNAQALSGIRVADYLRREGLRSSQWYYWHKKLRAGTDDACSASFTLVPIELATPPSFVQEIKVDLPNGLAITFSPIVSPEQLVQSLCRLEL